MTDFSTALRRLPACALATAIAASALSPAYAQTVFLENFDDTTGFTSSVAPFSDGGGDYLGIADGVGGGNFGGAPVPSALKTYQGFNRGFLTGMDLDGEGAGLPITLDWTGISIAGLSNFPFYPTYSASKAAAHSLTPNAYQH